MASAVWTVSYLIGAQRLLRLIRTIILQIPGKQRFIMGTSWSFSLLGYGLLAFLFLGAVLFDSTFGALAWTRKGAMAILFLF